jgi:hypothetical protein
MNLRIELQGPDATENTTLDIQDWLRRERLVGLQIERESGHPEEGQMGAELVPILSVVLGSAALVELVKCLHVWLTVRRPRVKIKVTIGNRLAEMEADNLPVGPDAIANYISSVVKALE